MSATVEERVVQMEFDNRGFERGIQTSMRSLDRLDKSLELKNGTKGFEAVGRAADGLQFDGLNAGIYAVQQRFSALEVVAVTALQRITNMAMNAGERLVKSLSVDQISAGFEKFGSKTTSVATLVAQGNALETVNDQLDRLNWFTDETSYNFTDMVSNIAKFTASGKGLEESVTAMEGIANWAALSGQNAATASRAMYQLSQAMGAGVMRKEDYKSIQNASMDTDEFREKCLEAGVACKTLKKNADGTYTSLVNAQGAFEKAQFAEHLTQDAWLTSDVMMQVFTDYSQAVTKIYDVTKEKGMLASEVIDEIHTTADEEGISIDEAIAKLGYLDEAGNALFDSFGLKAFEAAQKARTFGDAIDSVKDAVSTGWMKTFELIFGDAEQATELWTELANRMYDVFAEGINSQNEMLKAWNEAGGRTELIDSLWNVWDAAASVVTPIKEAFDEIFPPVTAERLKNLTGALKDFTAKLKLSDDAADKVKRTFKGLFAAADMIKKILDNAAKAIGSFMGSSGITGLGDLVLDITAKIGDALTDLNARFTGGGIGTLLESVGNAISGFTENLMTSAGGLSGVLGTVGSALGNGLSSLWSAVQPMLEGLKGHLTFGNLVNVITGVIGVLTGKQLLDAATNVKNFFENLFGGNKAKKAGSFKAMFKELTESLKEGITSLTTGVKTKSLLTIAAAIGVLTLSVDKLSQLKTRDIAKSVAGIFGLMTALVKGLDGVTKTTKQNGSKGLTGTAAGMVLIAEAVNLLAKAVGKLGGLDLATLGKGLVGVGGGLAELVGAAKVLNGVGLRVKTSVAMLVIAESCKVLGDAMAKFTGFNWDEIARGLAGMGGALAELTAAAAVLGQFGGMGSVTGAAGIWILSQSLAKIAGAMALFAVYDWDEIARGLAGMGGALAEMAGALAITGEIAGLKSLFAAGGIWVVIQGLDDMAAALRKIGALSWETLKKGLVGMGAALGEIGTVVSLVGQVTGFSSLFGAAGIWTVMQGLENIASALGRIGRLTWDEIARGLAGMGGALVELAAVITLVGEATGIAGLIGGGSLLLAIQGLGDLADAFIRFSEIDPEKIAAGCIAMGAALGETALGGLLNTLSGFGAGAIAKMAEPLGALADSIVKWNGVHVPSGLGTELGSLANGVNTFMFAGWGAAAIADCAGALGVLVDSVKKWVNVDIPADYGNQMSKLAGGVQAFMWSGGSAKALADAAPALGDLADSVKKWADVSIPDGMQTNLTSLANGVGAFLLNGWGAGGMADSVQPLKDLADAVTVWTKVTVPEKLGDNLQSIAGGVSAFVLAGWGADNISELCTPLKDLADAVKSWINVTVPEGFGDTLETIATGVKNFTWSGLAASTLGALAEPLGALADSVKKWIGVKVSEELTGGLGDLANALTTFSGVPMISTTVSAFGELCDAAVRGSGADFAKVAAGITALAAAMTDLGNAGGLSTETLQGITEAMSGIISSVLSALQSAESDVYNAAATLRDKAVKAVVDGKTQMHAAGYELAVSMGSALTGSESLIRQNTNTMLGFAKAALQNDRQGWWDAGKYLTEGFAQGISDNEEPAVTSAANMAARTLAAMKKGLRERSPSKATEEMGRYLDLGLVNGLQAFAGRAADAAADVGTGTLDRFGGVFAKISDVCSADLENAPVIRPVLDMDAVNAGLAYINGATAGLGGSVGLEASVSAKNAGYLDSYRPGAEIQNRFGEGSTQNITAPMTNNFYITSNDPEKIYSYISKRMSREVTGSRKRWET